ncbi:MAG: hypothetical protein ABJA66_15545 [Actinomycetota bacterium]
MKTNRYLLRFTFLAVIAVLSFAVSAEAQKKKKPVTKKPTTTATVTTNALEIKEGAEKVSIQLKNVTSFIYKLGGIATGIEDTDKEAEAGKLSKSALDKNAQFKQAVIQSIRNLRAGLAAMEVEFRTKPGLKPYLLQLEGITELSGQSEDLATAGRFTDSGKVLVTVIGKLADTLAAMP